MNFQTIKIFTLLIILQTGVFNSFSAPLNDSKINIIYPRKNQVIHASNQAFILGHISPVDLGDSSRGALTVNGIKTPIHLESGGFLAVVPIKSISNFTFELEYSSPRNRSHLEWPVNLPKKFIYNSITSPKFDLNSFKPNTDIKTVVGNNIAVSCKTMTKQEVWASLGKQSPVRLYETDPINRPGLYQGVIYFSEIIKKQKISYWVQKGDSHKYKSNGTAFITVSRGLFTGVYEIIQDMVKARVAPGKGYKTLLKKGSILNGLGEFGRWISLELNRGEAVYVDKSQVKELKNRISVTPNSLNQISIKEEPKGYRIYLNRINNANITWHEHHLEKKVSAELSNTIINIDRVNYLPDFKGVKNISWQKSRFGLRLDINLDFQPLWGLSFKKIGKSYSIFIKKPPHKRLDQKIKVILDPGHGPDPGAVGPTGLSEEVMTLKQCRVIERVLKSSGYDVVLTRNSKEGPKLYSRPLIAREYEGDVFLSIHYNATSDNANPYNARGFETYFYTQGAKYLAEMIHLNLKRVLGIPDNGIRFGNLAVCRNFDMPAILIELDYIIIPEAEWEIQTKDYQEKVANKILMGLEKWKSTIIE